MAITYTPDADDALFTAFAARAFIDPGAVAYTAFDGTRVDARFFFKPIQDEILNLIAKTRALENGGESMLQAITRSQIQLYSYSTYR